MTITKSDLLLPVLPGAPREWEPNDTLLEAARETIPQSPLVLTPAAYTARQAIAVRRWYLVRNELREKSRLSGRVEDFYTTLGIERPFNGLDSITAWLVKELDADNDDPDWQQIIDALIGQWVETGRIEPISEVKAKELSFSIYMQSNGRIDIYGTAQRKERG